MKAASLLIITVVLSAFNILQSQLPDYNVRVFDESFGIKNFIIRAIVKDKNDFLWILNQDQVQRFDGKHVCNFKLSEPRFIFCDNKNRIWAASIDQLYKFENDVQGFIPFHVKNWQKNSYGSVFQLSDGNVYLQTKTGFDILDEYSQEFRGVPLGISHLQPISVDQLDCFGESIFFQVKDSIYSLNLTNQHIRSLPGTNTFKLHAISPEKILVSRWDYATSWYDFAKGTITKIDIRKYFPSDPDSFLNIRRFLPLDNGRYLATSQKGLLQYDIAADSFRLLRLFTEGHSLNYYPSSVVYKDDNQNIWMSYEGGIVSFNPSHAGINLIRKVSIDQQSGWSNDVRGFKEDEKGNLWMITVNGFAYWDLHTGQIQSFPLETDKKFVQIFPSIRGLAYDGRYVILGPTDFGPWLYDVKKKTYSRPKYANDSKGIKTRSTLEGEFINQIYTLRNGDHLISGKSGLHVMNGRTYNVSAIHFPGELERIIFCYQDSRSRLWVRTRKNIYCMDSGYHVLHTFPQALGSNFAASIVELTDGKLLIGATGLYLLDLTQESPGLRKIDPYFDQFNISFLFIDKRNRIWGGSNKGIFVYDLQSKEKRVLDYADNVQGSGFYNQGAYLSSRGVLYLAGTNGINYLIPEQIETKHDNLHVSLLNMVVNEDDTSFVQHGLASNLKYDQNSIRFDFVAPFYNNAGKVQYRYKLKPGDAWKYIQNNSSLYLLSLPAGDYSFKVSASINGADWFEAKPVSFNISLPFWKTWWFFIACLMLAASLLYAFYRYRIMEVMKLQLVRNRISAELHDDIGTKLTNINILSTLTNQAIEEPAKAKELLTRISSEVQTSSEALDDIVWNINTANDSLQEIIPRMRRYAAEVLSGKNVSFNVNVPGNIQDIKFSMDKRHDVYLLFKEMVNNIHKHAHATEVLIEIEIRDDFLCMHVLDDGRGFDTNQPTSRNGLSNLKMRTDRWKGKISISSGEQSGTDIKIILPLRKIHSNGV